MRTNLKMLSEEKVRKLQEENTRIRGYEWVYPELPSDFRKLPMSEVREIIKRIVSIGNKSKCLEYDDIRYFATVSHPRIFNNLFEEDPVKKMKLMHQLEVMINVQEAIEKDPSQEIGLLKMLGRHMTGLDKVEKSNQLKNKKTKKNKKSRGRR